MDDNFHAPENQHFSFSNLLKLIAHRFRFGDSQSYYILSGFIENPRLADLSFDCHPGPINTVIEDAKNLHKSVFIYIYFSDNSVCQKTDELFHSPSISSEVRRNYIFYPISATSTDGYSLANRFKFKELPIIAVVQPRGHSLRSSSIFLNHQGFITESTLLSYIALEHQGDSEIIQQQDQEFLEAVAEAERNNLRVQEIENQVREEENQREIQKKKIEEDFNNLPKIDQNDPHFTIKFHFPDNVERIHSFPIEGTIKMIFTYVGHFLFPSNFILKCGYPLNEIAESDEPIKSISDDKNFVIYIDIDD